MEATKGLEYKVGIFVAISIFLTLAFIIALGGDKAVFHRSITLKIKADSTGGLSPGSVVQLSGINCGNVSGVEFDSQSTQVVVVLKIDRKFIDRISENSVASLQTQGALGDKYVMIKPGPTGGTPAKDGDFIKLEEGSDLISTLGRSGNKVEKIFDILDNIDKMTSNLNQKNFSGNLAASSLALQEILSSIRTNDVRNNKIKKSIDHVASILEKIDNGQGTLGGLINDPTVHEDLKAILGGAKRSTILKYLIRQAVKGSEDEEQEKAKNSSNKK